MDEADLIDAILGRFVPTVEVQIGMAYHAILEKPDVYRVPNGYMARDYFFGPDTVEPMLARIDRRGTFEVKGTREILGNTVVCRADHLFGDGVHEFKTTFNPFDAEKYLDSIQWRLEASVFGASSVTYHVACFKGQDTVELREIETLAVYPYPAMTQDIEALVRQFVDYVKLRGLDDHLRERQRQAEVKPASDKQLAFEGMGPR
jgi:hypothetical protein